MLQFRREKSRLSLDLPGCREEDSIVTQDAAPEEILSARFKLEFDYTRSVGPVVGRFLMGLLKRRIEGIRMSDGRVLVPPTEYDPLTSESLEEFVEVGDAGEVVSWSWVHVPREKHPLDRPFAWALIRLDGADARGFYLAGADQVFHHAEARITGGRNTPPGVEVWSADVPNPVAVRYAWSNLPLGSLMNGKELPAFPFRTGSSAPEITGKRLFSKLSTITLKGIEGNGSIHYSLDGSLPDKESSLYANPVEIGKTTTVRARFYRSDGVMSNVAEAIFTKAEPQQYKGKTLSLGVSYKYYVVGFT